MSTAKRMKTTVTTVTTTVTTVMEPDGADVLVGSGASKSGDEKLATEKLATVQRRYGRNGLGGRRLPVVYQPMNLPRDVLEAVRSSAMFGLNDACVCGPDGEAAWATRVAKFPFAKCNDYPRFPNHIYYEGYFHGYPTRKPIEGINPRTRAPMVKPALPIMLQGFLHALRLANRAWLQTTIAKLSARVKAKPQFAGTASAMADVLRTKLFADVAVQVHCGQGIPSESIAWHVDGFNSLVHLSLTLAGNRNLWTASSESPDGKLQERFVPLSPGCAYLSSPALVNHAPHYTECNWAERTIALQCRLDLSVDDIKKLTQFDQLEDLAEVLAEVVATPMTMPTLTQVCCEVENIVQTKTATTP